MKDNPAVMSQRRSKSLRDVDKLDHSLVDFAESFADKYVPGCSIEHRKSRGQFFTPKEIALFMAQGFDIRGKREIRFLDPGAGLGMLSAAFCSRFLNAENDARLVLDAYESDPVLIPHLSTVLQKCKEELEGAGHSVSVRLIEKDFIKENPNYLHADTLFAGNKDIAFYDFIIANPPYYKLNKNSFEARLMKEFVSGQPNIYSFFMALSLKMLKPAGEMIFIIPRSFCSGLYFKKFRKWLLDNGVFNSIHLFESRKEVFPKMDVLQENVIINLSPRKIKSVPKNVTVSVSKDRLFQDIRKTSIAYEDLLHRKNGDVFIKVPASRADVDVQHIVNAWGSTLESLGLKISTGPVVSFRAKHLLSREYPGHKDVVPLLWMHNMKGFDIVWPLGRNGKEKAISCSREASSLLLPVKNYVLVKRFTSKEQKRRLYAGVLLKSQFSFERIGIENHLNYIYKVKGELSLSEAYGVAGLLNSSIMDIFFRMLNGNTQVNALDVANLPLPSIEKIKQIGKMVKQRKLSIGKELDELIIEILGINKAIVEALNTGGVG